MKIGIYHVFLFYEKIEKPENFIIGKAKFSQLSNELRQWLCWKTRKREEKCSRDIEKRDVSRWQIYFMAEYHFLLPHLHLLSIPKLFSVDLKPTQKCHLNLETKFSRHKQLLIFFFLYIESCAFNSEVKRDFFQNIEHKKHQHCHRQLLVSRRNFSPILILFLFLISNSNFWTLALQFSIFKAIKWDSWSKNTFVWGKIV